jgi:hypothetical protein
MKAVWLSSSSWVAAALALVACTPDPPNAPPVGNGALGDGTFAYSCATPGDAFCSDAAGADPGAAQLPAGIAADATFGLAFTGAPGTGAGTTTLAPDAAFFDVAPDGTLHAKAVGYGAVLARDTNGNVVDFVNLEVHLVSSLAIHDAPPSGAAISVGAALPIRAEALDATSAPLAGTLAFQWESSDTTILTVTAVDTDQKRGGATLHAIAPGTAHVHVFASNTTGTVDVQVTP